MATVEITADNLNQLVQCNDIVLLDFWAAGCGPCRDFAPIYAAASYAYPDIVFGQVDTQAEKALALSFQIRSVPTIAVIREGVKVFCEAGALSASALEQLIEQVRALDMAKIHAGAAGPEGAVRGRVP